MLIMVLQAISFPYIRVILGVGEGVNVLDGITPDQAHGYSDGVYFGSCDAQTDGVHVALLWVSINKNGVRFQLAGFNTAYGAYNEYLFMRVIYVGWVGPWKALHFNPVSIFSY